MDMTAQDWTTFKCFCTEVKGVMGERLLRKLLVDRETNGVNGFAKKIGGKLYLSPIRFYQWIEGQK